MEGDAQSQPQSLKPRIETEAVVGSTGPAERISSVWLDAWQVRHCGQFQTTFCVMLISPAKHVYVDMSICNIFLSQELNTLDCPLKTAQTEGVCVRDKPSAFRT